MSNPTYGVGPIGKEVATAVDQFRLVKLNEDGKVVYAGATGAVFGAVTEKRHATDVLSSKHVAVHQNGSVKLRVAGATPEAAATAAASIKAGDAVFAAADGKVAATGTVQVGVAVENGEDDRVLTNINPLPIAAGS